LDGCGAGLLAYQDTQAAKDTLARRAANNEGVLYVYFEKEPIRQAPYVVVTEWYRNSISGGGYQEVIT
jgi:hypothetical protein